MKTSVEQLDPVKVKLTVEVEPNRVKKAYDRAARELAKQVSLPGFRPGRAPRRLLEQRVGKEVVTQQALEQSLGDYYVEALRREDVAAVSQPEIDLKNFDETEGCTFEATVEVRPEFDPPEHTGIGVTMPEWDVTDEDVDAQLASLRERFAEVDEVDRPAETGDYVTLDLVVHVDGELIEGGEITDALYEVGSEGVTAKLDDELVGKQAGDEFRYVDDLPDEYPEHGGEEAEIEVTVQDVRAKTLPDLDDDFALTASEFDTLDELRRDVRDNLLRRRIQQAQHELRGRIVEAYLANIDIPLPPSLVESERDARLGQLEQQAERYGLDVDQLLEMEGVTLEEYQANAGEQAEAAVKAQLVLDALGRRLEVDVTPDDLDQEIARHAMRLGATPQQIAEALQDQDSLAAIVGDVLRRKTIDAIVDAAEIEGEPPQRTLIELGLAEDPDAEDADGDAPSGLILPGQEASTSSGAGGLIVPGR